MTNIISRKWFYLASTFLVLIALISSASAEDISMEYDHNGFDKIRLDNVAVELKVTVGEEFSVEAEGEKDLIETLLMKVRGDKLVIYRDEDNKFWEGRGNESPVVTISMPKFTGFDLRGAVDAEIKGVDSDEVEFDLKGAGNIEIEGTCRWLIVDLKGAGNVEADELKCEEVDVDLKGAGNIEVYASKRINAEINGMGNIDVYGGPDEVSTEEGWFSNISIH